MFKTNSSSVLDNLDLRLEIKDYLTTLTMKPRRKQQRDGVS